MICNHDLRKSQIVVQILRSLFIVLFNMMKLLLILFVIKLINAFKLIKLKLMLSKKYS